MRTDRPVPAAASKRGDLADALSSDEESDAESHESDELLDDAAVKFVVPPPGAVKAMRRELARRANSVTQVLVYERALVCMCVSVFICEKMMVPDSLFACSCAAVSGKFGVYW